MSVEGEQEPIPMAYRPIGERLAETWDRVDMWERALNAMPDGQALSPASEELRQSIAVELNDLYPYFNTPVYFSGNGLFPAQDKVSGKIKSAWSQTDGMEGQHAGFTVIPSEYDPKKVQISQRIVIKRTIDSTQITAVESVTYAVYMHKYASVIPVKDIDGLFNRQASIEGKSGRLSEVVQEYSAELVEILQSAEYRKLEPQMQREALDTIVSGANEDANVRLLNLSIAGCKYLFAPNIYRRPISRTVEGMVIKGMCLGLESLERFRLDKRPIREKKDMLDPNAGLCYVVDPEQKIKDKLNLLTNQVVFIPSASQALQLSQA